MILRAGNYMLEKILEELSHYHNEREKLLSEYINARLNKSLETYYAELTKSFNYLKTKNELNMAKKINRC